MRGSQKIAATVLIVLLGAAIYGIVLLGRRPTVSTKRKAAAAAAALVDQTPLKTAQELAGIADRADEQALSKEAIRLIDHELDLEFESARRDAEAHPPALSEEAKGIEARLQKAEALHKADQALADRLTAEAAKASGNAKAALNDRLVEAKARLESDEDEVDDATQDLNRAGGGKKQRIEQLEEEHKAVSAEVDNAVPKYPNPLPDQFGLVHQYKQWSWLEQKLQGLTQARRAAESAAASLAAKHDALDAQIEAAKQASPDLAAHAKKAGAPSDEVAGKSRSHEESAAAVAKMKQIGSDQKDLPNLDRRADYEKQLAAVYQTWSELVRARQLAVVRRMLIGAVIVLGIALVGLFFNTWVEKLLGKTHLDLRQVQTLKATARLAVQVVAVLLILVVVFGPPSQLGTFLGLAGAGLTVALKDFIVGFLGWFVLMRKNGIRLGDWVEINGVTGEVIEIGLFHTVLMETGNWTDSGHPTGRRVTFTNSYAIEGHYFNFSTSGQWLWDELQVVLPTGEDPYPVIDAIQKRVVEATQASAKEAARELKSAAGNRDIGSFSAEPSVNLKPVLGGIELSVRYITQANQRSQLRNKLNQAAVELLGKRGIRADTATGQTTAPRN
jgi:small-conductance mechanosensitive channel